MKKFISFSIVVLSLFMLLSCASTRETGISTVSVTASAELELVPDIAKFSISVEKIEPTTEEARLETNKMVNQAVAILTSQFGISRENITTNYISVSPSYEWISDQRVLTGQRASQSISVTISDIDEYASIFDSLTKIDGISVSSPSLDKKDKTDDREKVRAMAVENARAKALAYANATGMRLSSVIAISDGSSSSGVYTYSNVMYAKAESAYDESGSTYYNNGTITLSDRVTVVYALSE